MYTKIHQFYRPKKLTGMKRPESRGLSGEHIELCAEGARHMPNLSGKWTEMHEHILQSSPVSGLLIFIFERGNRNEMDRT